MLRVVNNVALWMNDAVGDVDIWFLPGFAESHLCFRDVFNYEVAKKARVILFDPPGMGASPAKQEGMTIEDIAELWSKLIEKVSTDREVVLVSHSIAGIIATQTALKMIRKPLMLISIEGNLTKEDAYFSGSALNYKSSNDFYREFSNRVLELVQQGSVPMSYYSSLQFADPNTLWKLGSSTAKYQQPGIDYLTLDCSKIYYWCKDTLSESSKEFLLSNQLDNRELVDLGHWPMVKDPNTFYAHLLSDLIEIL